MNDEQLLSYMRSLDRRIERIEASIVTLNHEVGQLAGKIKNNATVSLIIKYVIFPLLLLIGGLIGIKLFFPF